MVGKKLKLENDVNGNTRYSVLERINIDLVYNKIDIIYSNYLRFPSGDIKLLDKEVGGSVPFSHVDGVAFKDKDGNIIPERGENGEIVLENGDPKQRLNDFTNYINILSPMFSIPLAKAIFRVEDLEVPTEFTYLDEE